MGTWDDNGLAPDDNNYTSRSGSGSGSGSSQSDSNNDDNENDNSGNSVINKAPVLNTGNLGTGGYANNFGSWGNGPFVPSQNNNPYMPNIPNVAGSQPPGIVAPGFNNIPGRPFDPLGTPGGGGFRRVIPRSESEPDHPALDSKRKVLASKKDFVEGGGLNNFELRYLPYNAPKREDCNKPSYFYITDKNGNEPDEAAYKFFDLMNERAGKIFYLCPDGKVLLKDGTNPESVLASNTTSKILARTINDGINGGVQFNHAQLPHKVLARVIDPYNKKKTLKENDKENNKIFMEDFDSGLVDLRDQINIQNGRPEGRPFTLQAAFMGHFICERFATQNYEAVKGILPEADFLKYHNLGVEREVDIIKEMAGIHIDFEKTRSEHGDRIYLYDDKTKPIKVFQYPNPQYVVMTVTIFVNFNSENTEETYWDFVLGSNFNSRYAK